MSGITAAVIALNVPVRLTSINRCHSFVVDGVQRPEVAEARVVHEHVEATELLGDLRQGDREPFAVADVEWERMAVELGRDRVAGFGVTIDDGDDCTFVRERGRRRLPDPRSAPGDDGDLAFELGARNFRHERSR